MEWEGGAAYYQRKAARARQVAEGVTTQAVNSRLLDEAVHCDQLAADADRGGGRSYGFVDRLALPQPAARNMMLLLRWG
jgi:hypothetical protein